MLVNPLILVIWFEWAIYTMSPDQSVGSNWVTGFSEVRVFVATIALVDER